jgi:hypothetical protein
MAQSKINITEENMTAWLASTGFLFPRNELEMSRFDKLYHDQTDDASDFQVDFDNIFKSTVPVKTIPLKSEADEENIIPLKMVARKGASLPKHILDKIRKNQDGRTKDDTSSSEKGD